MSGQSLPLILALTGPTATGKTDAALALAERHPVALISMDSAMVYRGMDIGTAKPPLALRQRYPHSLVDIRDPAEPYSAADFLADADQAVSEALAAGRLPVLVGGTMLYLRVFREGLASVPGADAKVRAEIDRDAERLGWSALYEELRRVDPEAAAGIHPNNRVRVQRALEVYRVTGEPLSRWWSRQSEASAQRRLAARLVEVAIVPSSRDELAGPIRQRLEQMLDQGFVEEVAALRARADLSLELPSMRAVGYRQVWEYLDGHGNRATLLERAAAATRGLAKRQVTWLNSWKHVHRLAPGAAEVQASRIYELLSR